MASRPRWPDPATVIGDLRQGVQQASALPPECARRQAEISAALTDEVGGIGQADPQPDPTDADAIEPRLAQHPACYGHPAIAKQAAERQARFVEAAVQGPLRDP